MVVGSLNESLGDYENIAAHVYQVWRRKFPGISVGTLKSGICARSISGLKCETHRIPGRFGGMDGDCSIPTLSTPEVWRYKRRIICITSHPYTFWLQENDRLGLLEYHGRQLDIYDIEITIEGWSWLFPGKRLLLAYWHIPLDEERKRVDGGMSMDEREAFLEPGRKPDESDSE